MAVKIGGPAQRGDNEPPRGARMPCARQCRGVFRALCVRCWMAHRIERNPDWKVFLNMAAAAGALTHVRSAPQALARTGGKASAGAARARACVTPSHLLFGPGSCNGWEEVGTDAAAAGGSSPS